VTGSEEVSVTLDYSIAATVTVLLLIYLAYALLRPERF
jgi:K+-transporting ATPase KdpF subunit